MGVTMSDFYVRYKSGEYEAVVRELTSLGERIYEPSVFSDAVSVACEVVDRSFNNLCVLRNRLTDLGYLFQHPEDALVEASSRDVAAIDYVESQMGALPLVVRKWYERIKSVDFSQQEKQMFCNDGSLCVPVSGLGLHTPLVFLSLPQCLLLRDNICKQAVRVGDDPSHFKRFLPLGTWASNSNPKGFLLPCKAFDAEFYNDGSGGVCFVEELRMAFKWGGFPFWRILLTGKRQVQVLRCVPEFERLLPVLTEGLLPI